MACPEGVEDMLTAKPGGIPETIDGMEHSTLNGGATVVLTVAPASRRVWVSRGQRPLVGEAMVVLRPLLRARPLRGQGVSPCKFQNLFWYNLLYHIDKGCFPS